MNTLSHKSKEEIYKCSKCGLCQSVCPLFLATKNELLSPRGRFIVLNNHINNGVKLSKDFLKNLDFCLNCNLCKEFCPSSIDTYSIITELKQLYSKKSFSLNIKMFYILMSFIKNIYRFFPFKSFFIGSFYDALFDVKISRKKSKKSRSAINQKVVFFEGCYNKYINPSDKNAVLNTLEELGFEVKTISKCCGYSLLSDGNIQKFKSNIQKIISLIPNDCKYIICSCDTCYETLKRAKQYVLDMDFDSKIIRFDEFLKLNNITSINVSDSFYFQPLMRNKKNSYFTDTQIIAKKGLCSLMKNFFWLRYPMFSKKFANKLNFSQVKNNEISIVTTCNLSKLGLIKLLNNKKIKNKVYSFSEFFALKKPN